MTHPPTAKTLLLIAERFPPDLGGVARSGFRTAQAIAALGWQVHVLAWTKSLGPGTIETSSDRESDAVTPGVTLHRLGLFSNWDFSLQHTMNVLEWLHQQLEFDAVWGHYIYPAGYLAVVFGETVGIPSTVSARGNDIDRLMFPPGDFARLMWTLERATSVSCVSADLARKVALLLGKPVPCSLLPNVVDGEAFHPGNGQPDEELRDALGILPQESILGFCGELRHKKGLPFLLSALVEVQRERPACLLVIGEVRPREQAHLAIFAGEHPQAAERILITGHLESQTDVARHYRVCDVVLQPSVWDGLPNAVLEAMACGKLVIASDAGGIPEAIDHGVTGFLIPKHQLHLLGQAILEVLQLTRSQRDALSHAARNHVLTCHNHAVEANRLTELLNQLVSPSPR